jgi:hypothetical protein
MAATLDHYTHLCSELVTFSWTDTSQVGHRTMVGNLEEIGEWKARILLDRPVAKGAKATVTAGNNKLTGTVRSWVFEAEIGYMVDVELDRNSRWSASWFQPEHMLCIQSEGGEAGFAAA